MSSGGALGWKYQWFSLFCQQFGAAGSQQVFFGIPAAASLTDHTVYKSVLDFQYFYIVCRKVDFRYTSRIRKL
jgi:hypothetical protein